MTVYNRGVDYEQSCVPQAMGDHLLRVVYSTFVSTPPGLSTIYDETCGIILTRNLAAADQVHMSHLV